MSFLAGRLSSGKEAAFFFQESKHAVNRLAEKIPKSLPSSTPQPAEKEAQADVLPEILKHTLPSKIFSQPYDPSSLSNASKWTLPSSHPNNASISSLRAMNPLTAYLSLPQVTFGPKRWELPNMNNSVTASTANELRNDRYTPINPEKFMAAAEGLQRIGKAFAVSSAIVFGGAAAMFVTAASKLELNSRDDIKTKGKDLLQPQIKMITEQLFPLRTWAEKKSKVWKLEREEAIKEKPIIKELSKILGIKTSN